MRFRMALAASVLVAALAGCSPYVYKDEIASFTGSVAGVAGTARDGRAAIEQLDAVHRVESWAATGAPVIVSGQCNDTPIGAPLAIDCALFGPDPDAPGTRIALLAPDAAAARLDHFRALLTGLDGYAAGLTAVTDATDQASLDTAATALTASIGKFADAVAKAATSPNAQAVAAAKAVSPLLSMGIGYYLDQRRYAVLLATVPVADRLVGPAADDIAVGLDMINNRRLRVLAATITAEAQQYERGRRRLSPAENEQRLLRLQAHAAAYRAARAYDWRATATAIKTAHAALTKAIESGTGQRQAVTRAMTALARNIKAARNAIAGAAGTD